MRAYLNRLLAGGITQPTRHGPYLSYPFFVPKANGTPRWIIDYSHLTLRTPTLHLPQFSDVLRAKPFPVGLQAVRIDLSHAFYSVPLHPQSRFLTTFRFEGQRFCFTRLPMGLSTSPSFLQHCLVEALAPVKASSFLLWTHTDDIILVDYPHRISEQLTLLLDTLQSWNFVVNKAKSQLSPTSVLSYLGLTLDFRTRSYAPQLVHVRHLFKLFPFVSDKSPLLDRQVFCGLAAFILSNSVRLYPFFSSLARLAN